MHSKTLRCSLAVLVAIFVAMICLCAPAVSAGPIHPSAVGAAADPSIDPAPEKRAVAGLNKTPHRDGDFTYLHDVDATAYSACGKRIVDHLKREPYYVAVSKELFTTANPNMDPICGRKIRATSKSI